MDFVHPAGFPRTRIYGFATLVGRFSFAVAALLPTASPSTFASQIVEMSFEQTARVADVVVVGTVTENPELGAEQAGVVVHTNRVHVDQYLKGGGALDIVVETIGGSYLAHSSGHEERMTQIAGAQPQLPSSGTRVLLFLTRYGSADAYMICSASHGVREIVRRPGASEDSVSIAFHDPKMMTARAAADFERAKAAGPIGPDELFHDDVSLGDLPELVVRAIAPVPKPLPIAPPTN
jgi:hypothetical protein